MVPGSGCELGVTNSKPRNENIGQLWIHIRFRDLILCNIARQFADEFLKEGLRL